MLLPFTRPSPLKPTKNAIEHVECVLTRLPYSVQVNLPAETGEMGVLANHVPSIEQLKPGLVEIIEESGGSKQFFRTSSPVPNWSKRRTARTLRQNWDGYEI